MPELDIARPVIRSGTRRPHDALLADSGPTAVSEWVAIYFYRSRRLAAWVTTTAYQHRINIYWSGGRAAA